jgi:lipoprotein-releasing system permease protein
MMILNLAISSIIRRKRQAIMMALGFALSVALFSSLAILIKAARTSFIKPFPVAVDMIVQLEGAPCVWSPVKLPINLNAIPKQAVEEIKNSFYAQDASGMLITWVFTSLGIKESAPKEAQAQRLNPNIATDLVPLVVTGIDTTHLELSPLGNAGVIIEGKLLSGVLENETVLDAEFAQLMGKKVGDFIRLGDRKFSVTGIAKLNQDVGFRAQAYVGLKLAQEMFGQGDVVNTIFVRLKPGMKPVNKDIRRIVGESANITTTRDYFIMLDAVSQAERIYLVTFFFITIVISALFIYKSIFSYIGEKIRDIGILKAIGWGEGHIIRLIVYENTILAFLGGIMGSAAGYFLANFYKLRGLNLPYFLNPVPGCNITGTNFSFTLSFQHSLYILLSAIPMVTIFGTFLGYLVALKISRVKPASALRSL